MTFKRILFSCESPAEFLSFLPVYRLLQEHPDVEVWLSGGWRGREGSALAEFYEPFEVDRARLVPLHQARDLHFDALVCAHARDAVLLRSSCDATVQLFPSVSLKHLAQREHLSPFDYVCLPGEYHAQLYARANITREDTRCVVTGFPRVDALVNATGDRWKLLQRRRLDPTVPTLLLAPTGERDNALEEMGPSLVSALSDEGEWNVLVKPHPESLRRVDWFRELAPLENTRVRLVRDLDVIPYLRAADVLLTDNSSVALEYALTQRPIVFLEVPRMQERMRAPPVDCDGMGRSTGICAEAPEEVVYAIRASLRQPYRHRRAQQAMTRRVFHEPGTATERVTQVVLHAAGLSEHGFIENAPRSASATEGT